VEKLLQTLGVINFRFEQIAPHMVEITSIVQFFESNLINAFSELTSARSGPGCFERLDFESSWHSERNAPGLIKIGSSAGNVMEQYLRTSWPSVSP
jgi:hypothetical protein